MAIINFPLLYVPDPLKGRPLFNCQIFVGEPDLDPEVIANQKQLNIVQEDGTVIPVAQPFEVGAGGVPLYNGSTVRLDVDGNFSLKILDRLGAQKYYIENVSEGDPITNKNISLYTNYIMSSVIDMQAFRLPNGDIITGKIGDIIEVLGRNSEGDGGSAKWKAIDATTSPGNAPNGSNIVAGNATISFQLLVSNPINPLEFGGSTVSESIERALTYLRARANLVPWTITVPQNAAGAAYDWDRVIDLSDDSWITLKGDGYVAIKATAAIASFFTIGIANKNNETDLSYFSCDAGDQTMTAAVICGSMRGTDVHHIETKATGTGSFTDGVLVGGDDQHTGGEPGAGNEQCTFHHIFDSGDSAVTRSMVYFSGGTSLGVQCYNVRATREDFVDVVGSATNSGFNGCSFHDIHANFLTVRTIKANSIVNLKRSVNSTKVWNIGATSNPSQNNVNYGLLVDSLDGAIVSGSLHTENLGVGYIIDDISIPSTVVRTHVNGVAFNNGDPNSQGVISATPSVKEKGGTIWDDTNKTLFVGKTGAAANDYETPILKRRVAIADDGFFKYTYPAGDYRLAGTIISVVPDMSAGVVREGLVSLRASGTAAANKLTNGALFSVTTGALTGTTGIDTHVTVSADSADGSIYVENRTGAARNFMITWLT